MLRRDALIFGRILLSESLEPQELIVSRPAGVPADQVLYQAGECRQTSRFFDDFGFAGPIGFTLPDDGAFAGR